MIRVIVVDDHAVVRSGVACLLATTDDLECVGAAGDGAGALELGETLRPDVVVLDLSLPDQDGMAVARALRSANPGVRILVLTAFWNTDLVMEVVRAGVDGYLLKQCEAEVLLDGVRAVAEGRVPLDPTVARELMSDIREHAPTSALTDREREVLEMMRQGHANKIIARRLQISERTVKAHISHIFERIGVSDRTQAALWAERHVSGGTAPWSAA